MEERNLEIVSQVMERVEVRDSFCSNKAEVSVDYIFLRNRQDPKLSFLIEG